MAQKPKAITGKPTAKISGLQAPVRTGTYTFRATWKNPSSLSSNNNTRRFQHIEYWFVVYVARCGAYESTRYKASYPGPTSVTIDLRDFYLRPKSANGKKLNLRDRNKPGHVTVHDLYPEGPVRITKISICVRGSNNRGLGPTATATRSIRAPKPPTLGNISQAANTGVVTCDITCDNKANDGYQPRTNTLWQRTIIDTRLKGAARKVVTQGSFTGNSTTLSYDVADRHLLTYSQYIRVHVDSRCRGFGGYSAKRSKELYISWPNQPVIQTSKVSCPARGSIGKVNVPIDLKATKEHPVTGVKLQKLVNVDYTNASQIPAEAGWTDCGVADNGRCIALSVPSEDVIPAEGTRTWLRVKVWNQVEELFVRYSAPFQLTRLYKAASTAEDDRCAIVSLTSSEDGAGAVVVIGFTNDGNTGCEVAWSEEANAWESTDQPKTYQFAWTDKNSKSGNWAKTATILVRGLTEAREYFFKARRYLDNKSDTTYSSWSALKSITPSAAPRDVVLSAPSVVLSGQGCDVNWAYAGGTQLSWQLLSNGRVVASGKDQASTCSLTAQKLESFAVGPDAENTGIYVPLMVEVVTSGGHAESSVIKVGIAIAPVITSQNVVCAAQPFSFDVSCTDGNAILVATLRAQGCTATWPGQSDQIAGDVVWSDSIVPLWTLSESDGMYITTITAPIQLDLRDDARYTLFLSATDPDTGLISEEISQEVSVEWTRKAPTPVIDVTPYDRLNDAGVRTLGCIITIEETEDFNALDQYDIWRVTPDGEYLIRSGALRSTIVDDKWAPYSTEGAELAYRVVLRTPDGDVDWVDASYDLPARELRVDFDGTYVEFPFNVSSSDSWEKDFEARKKLDGTTDGYWNAGASRRASLKSEIIRIEDAGTAARVRALGRYSGACLVRTPDGCCYAADVEVNELSWAFTDVVMTISLDATEVALPEEYMATLIEQEAETGEG